MKHSALLLGAAFSVAAALPVSANAAVVIDINQVGNDVNAVLSGSLDLQGLRMGPVVGSVLQIRGSDRSFFSTTSGQVQSYAGFLGPASFGTDTLRTTASSVTGSAFSFSGGFANGGTLIYLDPNYVSGSSLLANLSFGGTTLAALGLTPGQYVYSSPADSITFNIGPVQPTAVALAAAVPEPAAWAMMVIGFGAIGTAMRRRRSSAVQFA